MSLPATLPRDADAPLHLLMVIGDLKRSGTAHHLYELLRRLDRERFRAEVCCLHKAGGLVPEMEALGIPVHDLRLPIIYHPAFAPRMDGLRRLVRRGRYDLVHTFLFAADTFGVAAARLGAAPRVISSRRMMPSDEPPRRQRIHRLVNRWVDRIVTPSHAVREACVRVEGAPPAKVVTIYNGIRTERLRDAAPTPDFPAGPGPWLGSVGHLTALKGHRTLLRAFPAIRRRHPGAQLVLAGDGPLRDELQGMAAASEAAEAIHFLGERADVPGLLRRLDLFILPSNTEGMSNALLEAMACGRPVVATAVGGNPEVVVHGEHGLLVPAGQPDAMAEACAGVLDRPEWAAALGQAAEQRVMQRFSVQRMAEEFAVFYTGLATGRAGRCAAGGER